MKRVLGTLGLMLLVAGCASTGTPEVVNSAEYEIGFADGCTSGQMSQDAFNRKRQRDDVRYAKEDSYRVGWNDGFNSCGGKGGVNDPAAESNDRWMSGGPHK